MTIHEELIALQQRILAGEKLSIEEYRRIIDLHRASRTVTPETKRKKPAKNPDFDINAEINTELGL